MEINVHNSTEAEISDQDGIPEQKDVAGPPLPLLAEDKFLVSGI